MDQLVNLPYVDLIVNYSMDLTLCEFNFNKKKHFIRLRNHGNIK